MHKPKSPRHVMAANARWRLAEQRAQEERDRGIHDRTGPADCRQPFDLDLSSAGGQLWRIEPRLGYVAWRVIDSTGEVRHCAALKTLLRRIANELPRMLGARA